MKTIILILSFLISLTTFSQTELTLSHDVYDNAEEVFFSHQGEGEWDNWLGMSVVHEPIRNLRTQISKAIGKELDCLHNENCEAHITVITPVEFWNVLKKVNISMDDIDAIASQYYIQDARLMVKGLGSASATVNGQYRETYFVIVDSFELRNIRHQIWYKFVKMGGDPFAFDPSWFFPHITVGFIGNDLHESNGVLKDLMHSFDKRFKLKLVP